MADPAGEADSGALRLDFDRRVMLRFHGSAITSGWGLLASPGLEGVPALTPRGRWGWGGTRYWRGPRHRRPRTPPPGCAAARQCAGWSAAKRQGVGPPRPGG